MLLLVLLSLPHNVDCNNDRAAAVAAAFVAWDDAVDDCDDNCEQLIVWQIGAKRCDVENIKFAT